MRNFKEESKNIIICSLYLSISFYSVPNTPISLTFVSFHQILLHPVCFPPVDTHLLPVISHIIFYCFNPIMMKLLVSFLVIFDNLVV